MGERNLEDLGVIHWGLARVPGGHCDWTMEIYLSNGIFHVLHLEWNIAGVCCRQKRNLAKKPEESCFIEVFRLKWSKLRNIQMAANLTEEFVSLRFESLVHSFSLISFEPPSFSRGSLKTLESPNYITEVSWVSHAIKFEDFGFTLVLRADTYVLGIA